jgi:hypothetical protein
MISFRFLLLFLALLALSACDDEKSTAAVPGEPAKPAVSVVPAPVAEVTLTPASRPVTKPVVKQLNEPVRPRPKPAAVSKPVAKEDSVAVAPLRAELDLSLPADLFEELQSLVAPDEPPSPALLPPLFREEQAAESPFQLNGKLITNERSDDYLDSLEGAELQFEFKR